MSVEARALSLSRVMNDSAAVRLLSADLAPVILAIIAEHFPQGAKPRSAAELYELMVIDFEVMASKFSLPRKPQDYCTDWVKQGWLVRKSGTGSQGETLEPSEDALVALEAVQRWEKPTNTVTASRIESISSSLRRLARDTNEDIASRIRSLELERDAIDREIERVSQGDFESLSAHDTAERVADILAMAQAVPSDFARVRHDFERLNHVLRRQLLDPEGYRGDVLDDIFRGVDLIGDSDAGRSFDGFRALLTDRKRSAWADEWIAEILDSESAAHLPAGERSRLRRLFRDMEDTSDEVARTKAGLARSLRNYVTSEQFAEDRRMIELLREARGLAADAAQGTGLQAFHRMETPLQRIGMTIHSVSRIRLANPAREVVEYVPEEYVPGESDLGDLTSLVRESEIDFEELGAAVRATVDKRGSSSIAAVLAEHPATQGLGSVVGLIHLATRYGIAPSESPPEPEHVEWSEADGSQRRALIPRLYFDTDSLEELP